MSLILEALKKSESRRRLGEAPDLGTPFTVTRRRRNPLPLIVILIAVAAGLGWWFLRTMPPPAGDNTIASVPPPARPAAGPNAANPQQTAKPAAQIPATAPVAPAHESAPVQAQAKPDTPTLPLIAKAPARADGGAAAATAPGAAADPQAMRAMSRHVPESATPQAAPAMAKPKPPSAPTAAVQPPVARAATPGAPAPTPAPAPVKPADSNVTPPDQIGNAKASSDTGASARPADAPASLPQYYELAYGVRKDIPPFALSMHVFAADAGGRFVVVDGERKAEGDSIKEGLVVREIRPDGMVLEFRGQRFFYPRPGH
jgi:general secretion pathway protein B